MRKALLVLTLACGLLTTGRAFAQRGLPGQLGVQVNLGTVDGLLICNSKKEYSYFGSVALTRSNRGGSDWIFGMGYLQKDYRYGQQVIPKAQFTGEIGYMMPLIADRGHNVRLMLGISGLVGYETSNGGTKLLYDGSMLSNKDGFIWGGALTAQFEAYLSDKIVFLLNVKERGLSGSSVGTFHTQMGVGLRFIIN